MDDKKTATQMPADVCQRLRADILELREIERSFAELQRKHGELTARRDAVVEEYAITGDTTVNFDTNEIGRKQVVTPIEQGKKQAKAK